MKVLGISAVPKPEHHLTILPTALHSPVSGFSLSRRYVEIEANNEDDVVPEDAAPPNFDAEQVAYNEVTTPWKEGQEMYFPPSRDPFPRYVDTL